MKWIVPVAFVLGAVAGVSAASAHPGLEVKEARIGAGYKAVIKIPHGCDKSATTKVRVQIPEGMIAVKPMPKPGWTVETVRGPYARSYPFYHGAQLSEGVREIVWTGRLPDDYFDEFVFSGFLADSLQEGATLYFPIYQDCEKGSHAWIEVPAAGQSAHQLASPAVGLKLLASGKKATSYRIGALVVEAPWARATPAGVQVGAGYVKVTNTGSEPDRLVGGSLASAATVEIHETQMVGDVAKMRRVDKGLEIKPGQSVELAPHGHHLMLMGLKQPLKDGDVLQGTLVFEKAGTLAVEFRVRPAGSAAGGGGHSHH
jgi:periplasmic copper chaperone A